MNIYFDKTNEAEPVGVEVQQEAVPRKRFVKDLVKTGVYRQGDKEFTITKEHFDKWVESFEKCPLLTDHTGGTKEQLGSVNRLYYEDDTLYGELEAVGSEAIATVYRTGDVSIGADDENMDHVALTPFPVYKGQEAPQEIFFSERVEFEDKIVAPEPQLRNEEEDTESETEEVNKESIQFTAERKLAGILFERLESSGTCTPAAIKDLKPLLLSEEAIKLDENGESLLSKVVSALEKNEQVVRFGEKTKGQESIKPSSNPVLDVVNKKYGDKNEFSTSA